MPTTQTSPSTPPVIVPAVMPPTQTTPGQDVVAATPAVMTDMVIYGTYNNLNSLLNADGLAPLTASLLADAKIPPPVIPPPVLDGLKPFGPSIIFPPIEWKIYPIQKPKPGDAPDAVPTPVPGARPGIIITFSPNLPGVFVPPFVSIQVGPDTIIIYENYRIVFEHGPIVTIPVFPGITRP